jgi:hypothetical protein
MVEAEILVEDKVVKLQKIYREKWTKKRNEADRTLTGHETEYYINEIPCKSGEYSNYINNLINEELFKLITSVTYFNQQMHWTKRRDLLMDIIGALTDEEVIEADERLKPLLKVLEDRTLEDHAKWVKGHRVRVNKEIEKIPVRIDEIIKGLPELPDNIDFHELKQEKNLIISKIDEIDQRINSQELVSKAFREKHKELSDAKRKLQDIVVRLEKNKKRKAADIQNELEDIKELANNLARRKERLLDSVNQNHRVIADNDKYIQKLRQDFSEIKSKRFVEPDKNNFKCTTCRQALPNEDIESLISTMRSNFQAEVERQLTSINTAGIGAKKEKERAEKAIEEMMAEIEAIDAQAIENSKKKIELSESLEIEKEVLKGFSVEDDEEFQEIFLYVQSIETEIEGMADGSAASKEIELKRAYQKDLNSINYKLNSKEIIEKQQARIKELEEEQELLRDQMMELERDEYLIGQFTIKKVDMMEESINQRFQHVKFKLFNRLTNGAIEDCCEVTLKGVPYSDLNTAGTINAGLDVINVLTDKYQVSAPVFLDNSESINSMIDVDSQVIKLVVTKDKNMKVEVA